MATKTIFFFLQEAQIACYASVTGRFEEAKVRLHHAVELEKDVGYWR
jgi:hypothetical protein